MATRKIKNAKDITTDELIYFKGHAQATFMSDGRTVEDAINGINTDECPKIYTWNWDGSESGTLTQEEYDAIIEADFVATLGGILKKGDFGDGRIILYDVAPDINQDYTLGYFKVNISSSDFTFTTSSVSIVSPSKTSELENDSDFVSSNGLKTINGESIVGSGDITISGGSSSGGAYAEVSHGTSDTTFTLTPNVFHVWDEVTELNITLDSEISGVANEYLFQFTSGSEPTALTLPDDIKWANDSAPTIEANMIYQVSILKGLASVLEWDNVAELLSFTANNYTYYAEVGMSWRQFVDSIYNISTNGYSIPDFDIRDNTVTFMFSSGMSGTVQLNSADVLPDSLIIENAQYSIQMNNEGYD